MTRNLRITLVTLTLATFATLARADTVTLNDGTKVEGTIVEETDAHVKIQVQVTPTIRDEKTIARTDIASVSKLTEEDLAFRKVEALVPTRSLLSASDYETIIRSQPERFLNTYPRSKYKDDVEAILATLNEEKEKAAKGAVKIDDEWITSEARKLDPANVDARILLFKMRQKAVAGDYLGALRDFDELEKNYAGTQSLVDAVPVAADVLGKYAAVVDSSLRDYDFRMEKRKKDLLLLPEHERKANEEAFKKEIALFKAASDNDKKLGHRWVAVNPNHKEGLQAGATLIASESKRLAEIDITTLEAAARTLAKTQALVGERKLAQAEAGLAAARSTVMGGLYLESVAQNVARLAGQLDAEAAAAKQTESAKALEVMDAYKGTTADGASTANPLARMMEQKKATAAKGSGDKPETSPKSSSSAKPRTTTAPPVASSGGGGIGFQTIIVIGAVILVLVTGGAIFMQKKKG